MTREGIISFSASSPLEDIESRSAQTAAVLDLPSRQLAFTVPVKSFQFKRSLMQEHFNENYMETERYPKATFTGQLAALDAAALQSGNPQKVVAEGDLTIHGVTKRVQVPGTLALQNGRLLVQAAFSVAPADYNIEIPLLVRNHIAKIVAVQVALNCAAAGSAATVRP
jgi:polyisoprenoid-binding protein YceI